MERKGTTILVVEDERAQRDALSRYLKKRGYSIKEAGSAEEGLELLRAEPMAMVITDLRLPDADGLELVRRARELEEEMPVLLVTAYASVESVIEALRAGAQDYLLKPLILSDVGRKVENLLAQRDLVRENARLRAVIREQDLERQLIARSPTMEKVVAWVQRAAGSRANVLITGETGAGKEIVARTIHESDKDQAERPFLPINISAIPETMVESELFGHEKGAFTGADTRREGILRAARDGTVLLDEIGELPLTSQAKLLRALEARAVRPVGSDREEAFAARILCATHRNLKEMTECGTFREDLYYRLNVLHIEVPPLRERPEDLPALVRTLLHRHAKAAGAPVPVVSGETMRLLCEYAWPGNIRELSNVLERVLIMASDGRIVPEHLPEPLVELQGDSLNLQDAVARFEKRHIAHVLQSCGGSREQAAELLGISTATLYRRLERLKLKGFAVDKPDPKSTSRTSSHL